MASKLYNNFIMHTIKHYVPHKARQESYITIWMSPELQMLFETIWDQPVWARGCHMTGAWAINSANTLSKIRFLLQRPTPQSYPKLSTAHLSHSLMSDVNTKLWVWTPPMVSILYNILFTYLHTYNFGSTSVWKPNENWTGISLYWKYLYTKRSNLGYLISINQNFWCWSIFWYESLPLYRKIDFLI